MFFVLRTDVTIIPYLRVWLANIAESMVCWHAVAKAMGGIWCLTERALVPEYRDAPGRRICELTCIVLTHERRGRHGLCV